MRDLAEKTGGDVIGPADQGLIDFRWPPIATPLTPWMCALALLCIAAGGARWRMGRLTPARAS